MKNLFKAVAIITVFSVLTRILGFLFRIYLANKIGSESLGIYQVGFSLFIVLATIVGSGLPIAISKLTAKYRADKNQESENSTVSASLVIGLVVSLFICITIIVFNNSFSKILANKESMNILLMLVPAVIATAIFSSFRGSLWGQKNHFAVSFTEFIEQIIRTVIAIMLLEFSIFNLTGGMSASLALTIGCFASAAIAGWYYYKSGGKVIKPNKNHYSTVLKSAAPITGVRVASSLIQPLIAVLIPLRLIAAGYTESQAMSQLGTAVGMTFPLLFLPITIVGALSTALIPELSGLLAKNEEKEVCHQIGASLLFALFVASIVVPVYIGLGPHIGSFLFNNISSGIYLSTAAWIMVPISLASITASVLNSLGLEVKSFKNYSLGSAVLIACIWFLPKYIGVEALIYGMGICMTIVTALNLRMINKYLPLKNTLLKPTVLMALFILPSSLLAKWTYNAFSFIFPNFISLALCASLASIMFILLCLIFELINLDVWFASIRKIKLLKSKRKTKLKSV